MAKKRTYYTKKDLVNFGNYLLSEKRKATILKADNLYHVNDVDIANFKYLSTSFKN